MILEHNRQIAEPEEIKVGGWYFRVIPTLRKSEFLCKVISIDDVKDQITLYSIPKKRVDCKSPNWISVGSLTKVMSGVKPLYTLTEEEVQMVRKFEQTNSLLTQ